MTVLETQYMEAVKQIAERINEPNQIDWEQRRYEIARDVLASTINGLQTLADETGYDYKQYASCAIKLADTLITELKK